MSKKRLRKCPFCGERPKDEYPTVCNYNKGKWTVYHKCGNDTPLEVSVCINTYGSTKEEAIKRWNRRFSDV